MAFLVLSSITELDRINLLKAVTSISEIKIFLNQEIEVEFRLKERIFRLFCARGKLLNGQDGKISKQPKCVMLHHNNLYLKMGPFNTEIVSYYPYRAMFHNVS